MLVIYLVGFYFLLLHMFITVNYLVGEEVDFEKIQQNNYQEIVSRRVFLKFLNKQHCHICFKDICSLYLLIC